MQMGMSRGLAGSLPIEMKFQSLILGLFSQSNFFVETVEILLLTTLRFFNGNLLLQEEHLIELLLERTSSRLSLFDTDYTTVSFIQITQPCIPSSSLINNHETP